MTPEELAAIDSRLESFNEQLAEGHAQLDYGTLDRAADLAARYKDKSWVKELDPPKTHDKRGRPLKGAALAIADSKGRFGKWLGEARHWPLVRSRASQLLGTNEFCVVNALTTQRFTSERAVKPLYRLEKAGYSDKTAQIINQAQQLAGDGCQMTSAHTKQAVDEFLARQPKPEKKLRETKSKVKRTAEKAQGLLDQLDEIGAYAELSSIQRRLTQRLREVREQQQGAA